MCLGPSKKFRINLHLPNLTLLYLTNISRFGLNWFKTHSRPSKVRATECCWWIGGTPKCRLDCWDRCAIEEVIAAPLFQSSLISYVALGRQQILWCVLKLTTPFCTSKSEILPTSRGYITAAELIVVLQAKVKSVKILSFLCTQIPKG